MHNFFFIANYLPDGQESMERFAQMLAMGFEGKTNVRIVRPANLFGRLVTKHHIGIGKWLGYLDKYVIFPFFLLFLRLGYWITLKKEERLFHICDHSNAVYINFLPTKKTSITCHDVLAIRGALGYKDAYCDASKAGKLLQQWILSSLFKCRNIAFVSAFTQQQYLELSTLYNIKTGILQNICVIYNGFNANFSPLSKNAAEETLKKADFVLGKPYLLHVGSALPRKNRILLLQLLKSLFDIWDGIVVFAGEPIDIDLKTAIDELGVGERVFSVVKPSHHVLVALYSACHAFVFPSFSEGFGWPLIEAQACGAPVLTSNLEPMVEVCGGGAIHLPLNDIYKFSNAIFDLQNPLFKNRLIEKGFINVERFTTDTMIREYSKFLKLANYNV